MPITDLDNLPESNKKHTTQHTDVMYDPSSINKIAKVVFSIIPKDFHPNVHFSNNIGEEDTGVPDYMSSNDTLYLGNNTNHTREPLIGYSIGSHLKMAKALDKVLKSKKERPSIGPYHDHIYESLGDVDRYRKDLFNFLHLNAPKLMYDYLKHLDLDNLPDKKDLLHEYTQHLYSKKYYHPEQMLDYIYQINKGKV